ncbi:MAG: hypothetical protein H7239_15400, partial [Flavobacterium sp.]|nr:hypothetical protein [Flavobacterium sp.]
MKTNYKNYCFNFKTIQSQFRINVLMIIGLLSMTSLFTKAQAQCDQSSAILENSLSYTNSGYTGSCPSNYVNAFGYTSPANWYKVTIF